MPLSRRRTEELVRAERTLVQVRWFAVVFAVGQVQFYENMPYPPGVKGTGFVLSGLLVAINVVAVLELRREASNRRVAALAMTTLVADTAVVVGFVWLFTFDNDSVFFLLLFVLPAEAALKFQLAGALGLWGAVTTAYAARQIWGAARYGFEVSVPSITYRMGILLLLSLILGLFARGLDRRTAQLTEALEHLTEARDRLEREARWRSSLIDMLAHDFRSPVASATSSMLLISGQVDHMPKDTLLDVAEAAVRQNRRALALADDVLTMARAGHDRLELHRENVEVVALVHRAVDWLDMQDEVAVESPADLSAFVDPARLEQIVTNLLSNGARHGRPPVTVSADSLPGRGLELRVADSGQGVPTEQRSELFGQYSRGPRADSVGLGLWLVSLLSEAHGGDARYVTDGGRPTFVVRLPGDDEDAADRSGAT